MIVKRLKLYIRNPLSVSVICEVVLLLLLFQNCGTGFENSNLQSANSVSLGSAPRKNLEDSQANMSLPAQVLPTKDTFFGIHEDLIWNLSHDNGLNLAGNLALQLNRLEELGVGSLRIPMRWMLISDGSECDVLSSSAYPIKVNEQHVSMIKMIVDSIPKDIDLLAYLDSPPMKCKELFKSNPVVFSMRYATYVKTVVDRFKYRIKNYQLWNEANNVPFSLRLANGEVWTAWGFANYVHLPGYKVIKEVDPSLRVVFGGATLNGVVGHGDGVKDRSLLLKTTWYIYSNFLNYFYSAIRQFTLGTSVCKNSGQCHDVIGIQPYWYDPSKSNSYYSPHDQTYGPSGTVHQMVANKDTSPIWWTETGSMVSYGGPEAQAKNLASMLDIAQSNRTRSSNPLQRVFWFNLLDEKNSTSDFGLQDSLGNRRPSFFAYKDKVFTHGQPVSIFEDFSTHSVDGRLFSNAIWQAACYKSTNCGAEFKSNWTPKDTLHFTTPRLHWAKTGLISKRTIPFDSNQKLYLSFDFNSFGPTDYNLNPDDIWGEVNLASRDLLLPTATSPTMSANFAGVHLRWRRTSATDITIGIESFDQNNVKLFSFFNNITGCQVDTMNRIEFEMEQQGNWKISLIDKRGQICHQDSSQVRGTNVITQFPKQEIAVRFAGMTGEKSIGGFFKLDNIKLTTKKLLTAEEIITPFCLVYPANSQFCSQ